MSEAQITLLTMVLSVGIPLILILLGFIVGGVIERAHFKKLAKREEALAHLVATNLKRVPEGKKVRELHLVKGDVVISSDYFKTLVAGLKHLFGGRLYSMETLLKRARWEAYMRLKEEAQREGAHMIINVRFETARIGGTMVEVLAYGTAVRFTSATP